MLRTRFAFAFGLAVALGLLTGCRSMLPKSDAVTTSRWKTYQEVEAAFAKIQPDHTSTNELKQLGFHPDVSPNVKLLTYVDLINYFMPNPGIQKSDLDEAVRECIEARSRSQAYLVELNQLHSERHGNVFLDVLAFKRVTYASGWTFKGIILLKDGTVAYKLASGEPQISNHEVKIKPLGPLQEMEGVVGGAAGGAAAGAVVGK